MQIALELLLAGTFFAAALVCCAGSWYSMLRTGIGIRGAVARYGVGSLTNTFLPGRAGDVVRVGLFGRIAPGGVVAVAGAAATIGAVRWLALMPLGIAGTLGSTIPPLALVAAGVAVVPLPVVWLLARRGSKRACTALAPLRGASRRTCAIVVGWVFGTLAARVVGVAITGMALGVPHPIAASLLVIPAMELAGVVPLMPANVGLAGGAAAVAFHAEGASMHAALAAGFILHAVETATAVTIGSASAIALLRAGVRIRPRRASPVRHPPFAEPLPM